MSETKKVDQVVVYKSPGSTKWCGLTFDSKSVDRSQLEEALADGWRESPQEAAAIEQETKEPEPEQAEQPEATDEDIYNMTAEGMTNKEIAKRTGNKAPWFSAERHAKANGLPYPPVAK